MNKLIASAVIALTATTAQAQDIDCAKIGDIASIIMENRQIGVSMSEQMSAIDGVSLLEGMVIDAYRAPRMSMPENRMKMVEDFRAEFELMCYESTGVSS